MIKVSNEVKVWEVDGLDVDTIGGPRVKVDSHWNCSERVVLEVEGKRVTVLAKDLAAAIANATNTARF